MVTRGVVCLRFLRFGHHVASQDKDGGSLEKGWMGYPQKRVTAEGTAAALYGKIVVNFVTQASRGLFQLINISASFLAVDPAE